MSVMFISAVHWHCLTVISPRVKIELTDDNFGCMLMKGTAGVFDWYGCYFFPPFVSSLSTKNCFHHRFFSKLLYSTIMWRFLCVSTISASTISHKHWEPGVSLCALGTLFCWVLHSLCCLASQPIAAKLNPISGSAIREAPCSTAAGSNFHLCKCQFTPRVRQVTGGEMHRSKEHANVQWCTLPLLLPCFVFLFSPPIVQNLQTQNAYPWESAMWNITWFAKPESVQLLSVSPDR